MSALIPDVKSFSNILKYNLYDKKIFVKKKIQKRNIKILFVYKLIVAENNSFVDDYQTSQLRYQKC